ncbi:hypothetical protein R1flu_011245 [Riccia fluitans]|uniref:Uncharacterized protein n=1 Tax=Riccia fluitans TaxID=41844 RepID=A0ABD1Z7F5_9MARC
MSGIRRRSSRQSDIPPEERPSQRRRHSTSPNYELPHDEAMETIDQLVVFAKGAAGPQGQLPVNVSREGLKEYLVFPGSEESSRVVTTSVIEAEFLRRIGHKSLKDAWTTVAHWFDYQNAQLRNEGWFIDELVFFSSQGHLFRLNHTKQDRASIAKFWEGWQAVVQLIHTKFLTRMMRQNQEEPRANPLLLGDEPRNAFGDTHAQWDVERCELVRERDQLKEDLHKAQDVLADAAQWEEALRAEHKRLQEEYSRRRLPGKIKTKS